MARKYYLKCSHEDSRPFPEYGSIVCWTMEQILDEINRDRSSEWTDYDRTDWREGLREWTWYTPFTETKGRNFMVMAPCARCGSVACGCAEGGKALSEMRSEGFPGKGERLTIRKAFERAEELTAKYGNRFGTFRVYHVPARRKCR